ncbi:MAG: hypothetical protein ABI691_00975 [Ginsengibacter sp.]
MDVFQIAVLLCCLWVVETPLTDLDETTIPAHAQHFKSKDKLEEIFPGARNFR